MYCKTIYYVVYITLPKGVKLALIAFGIGLDRALIVARKFRDFEWQQNWLDPRPTNIYVHNFCTNTYLYTLKILNPT